MDPLLRPCSAVKPGLSPCLVDLESFSKLRNIFNPQDGDQRPALCDPLLDLRTMIKIILTKLHGLRLRPRAYPWLCHLLVPKRTCQLDDVMDRGCDGSSIRGLRRKPWVQPCADSASPQSYMHLHMRPDQVLVKRLRRAVHPWRIANSRVGSSAKESSSIPTAEATQSGYGTADHRSHYRTGRPYATTACTHRPRTRRLHQVDNA